MSEKKVIAVAGATGESFDDWLAENAANIKAG